VITEDCVFTELVKGRFVVSDRYKYSGLVYQTLASPFGSVTEKWVEELNWFAPPPHIFVYLDVPAEVAWKRIPEAKTSVQLYENIEQLKRVKQRFDEVVERLVKEPEYCPGAKEPRWFSKLRELLEGYTGLNIAPENLYPEGFCYPIVVWVKGVDNGRERNIEEVADDIEAAIIYIIAKYLSRKVKEETVENAERRIEASRGRGVLTIYGRVSKQQ